MAGQGRDKQITRLRHLNLLQHECYLGIRISRVRLPDGSVQGWRSRIGPDWIGQLDGFTLLFKAPMLLAQCAYPSGSARRAGTRSAHASWDQPLRTSTT